MTSDDSSDPSGGGANGRVATALAILVFVALAPWVQMFTAQPRARFATTASLAERGTFEITDRAASLYERDQASVDGRTYGDKAPGQPVAAVPFFWIADVAGFADTVEHRTTDCCVQEPFIAEYHLGAWWIGLFFAVVPAALLCALMYRHVEPHFPCRGVPVALAMSFSTLLLPFGTRLYGHVAAALLCFWSWHRLGGLRPSHRDALMAGIAAGLAVSVEYSAAIYALVVLLGLLGARQARTAGVFVSGTVPAALALAMYHTVIFGHPLATSYGTKSFDQLTPPPDLAQALTIVFGSRGLVYTPVVLVALAGLVLLWRHRPELRPEVAISASVFLGFWALQASWVNPWGGATPGPRYLIPALPFLALPLAAAWTRVIGGMAVVIGMSSMLLATITLHYIYDPDRLFTGHLRNLNSYGMSPTIYGLLAGDALGVAITGLLVLGALWFLRDAVRRSHDHALSGPRPVGDP